MIDAPMDVPRYHGLGRLFCLFCLEENHLLDVDNVGEQAAVCTIGGGSSAPPVLGRSKELESSALHWRGASQ